VAVEQTNDASGAPAFVIPLDVDARMECGRTYEVALVPASGVLSLVDIHPDSIAAAVSSVTGCRATEVRATAAGCVVRWRCHSACPHVAESTAWSVAESIAGAIAHSGGSVRVERCGMVWIQSNWLYLLGGIAVAGMGAVGMALFKRRKSA